MKVLRTLKNILEVLRKPFSISRIVLIQETVRLEHFNKDKHDGFNCQHEGLCPEAHALAHHMEKQLAQETCSHKGLCLDAHTPADHLKKGQQAREQGDRIIPREARSSAHRFKIEQRVREQSDRQGLSAKAEDPEDILDQEKMGRERVCFCISCQEDLEAEKEAIFAKYLDKQEADFAQMTEQNTALSHCIMRLENTIDDLLHEQAYLADKQADLLDDRSFLIEERWNLLNERDYLLEEQERFSLCQSYLEREMKANNDLYERVKKDEYTITELLRERYNILADREIFRQESEYRLQREMEENEVLLESLERANQTAADLLQTQEYMVEEQNLLRGWHNQRFSQEVNANNTLVEKLERQEATISELLKDRSALMGDHSSLLEDRIRILRRQAQLLKENMLLMDDRDRLLEERASLHSQLESYKEDREDLIREMAEDNAFAETFLQKNQVVDEMLEEQPKASFEEDDGWETTESEIEEESIPENDIHSLDKVIELQQERIRRNDEAIRREELQVQLKIEARIKAVEQRERIISWDDKNPLPTVVVGQPAATKQQDVSVVTTTAPDQESILAADAQQALEMQVSEISEKLAHLITTSPIIAEKILVDASEICRDNFVAEMAERDLANLSLSV